MIQTALTIAVLMSHPTSAVEQSLHAEFEYGGTGELFQPEVVVEGPEEQVYILDSGNHRIVQLDRAGQYVRSLGSIGTAPGKFLGPIGMDVAADGTIYVADLGNLRIQVLSPEGEVLSIRKADRGISDLIALDDGSYLVSRSFQRGRALFYQVDRDGYLVAEIGRRLGASSSIAQEVSLNTFRASLVNGQLWVAFGNLSRVLELDGGGAVANSYEVRTPQSHRVHADFHRDVLAQLGRPEVCAQIAPATIEADLATACSTGERRYTTYVASVDGFEGRRFVLTLGVLHEIDATGVIIDSMRLLGANGGEAFAHRMSISDGGRCYTVDSFHQHVVRRYNLSRADGTRGDTPVSASEPVLNQKGEHVH